MLYPKDAPLKARIRHVEMPFEGTVGLDHAGLPHHAVRPLQDRLELVLALLEGLVGLVLRSDVDHGSGQGPLPGPHGPYGNVLAQPMDFIPD